MAQVLLAVAALGAGYLALVSLTSGSLAGCGPESGCSKVLQTRWAYWLGVPVSIPAVFAYLGLAGALWLWGRRKPDAGDAGLWSLIVTLSAVIAGAALWFVGLQVFGAEEPEPHDRVS